MDKRFDVNDIKKLMYNARASHHLTIEMDADEGWLYISTDTIDDWNREIDYSCTFPLEEWMLGEVRKAVREGEVSFWEMGECQYRSRVDYDLKWDLFYLYIRRRVQVQRMGRFSQGL